MILGKSILGTVGAVAFSVSLLACIGSEPTKADLLKPVVTIEDIQNNYKRTRLLTVVHRWLELIENPDRPTEPFKEIVADDIFFDFSSGSIENFDDLVEWVKGPASSVAFSKHDLSGFEFKETGENQYALEVIMDWHGLLPNGQRMAAKTHHKWTVIDNPTEPFARIKTIKVDVLEPFTVVES